MCQATSEFELNIQFQEEKADGDSTFSDPLEFSCQCGISSPCPEEVYYDCNRLNSSSSAASGSTRCELFNETQAQETEHFVQDSIGKREFADLLCLDINGSKILKDSNTLELEECTTFKILADEEVQKTTSSGSVANFDDAISSFVNEEDSAKGAYQGPMNIPIHVKKPSFVKPHKQPKHVQSARSGVPVESEARLRIQSLDLGNSAIPKLMVMVYEKSLKPITKSTEELNRKVFKFGLRQLYTKMFPDLDTRKQVVPHRQYKFLKHYFQKSAAEYSDIFKCIRMSLNFYRDIFSFTRFQTDFFETLENSLDIYFDEPRVKIERMKKRMMISSIRDEKENTGDTRLPWTSEDLRASVVSIFKFSPTQDEGGKVPPVEPTLN